jgi:hypothetical protein
MERTIFTTEQRKEIYEEVKKILIKNEPWNGICLCPNLNDVLEKRIPKEEYRFYGYGKTFKEYLFEYFPELLMVKPDKVRIRNIGNAWWEHEDKQIRLEKLDKMIKLCDL